MIDNSLKFFVHRRRATILFLAIIIIYGFLAYLKIPKESAPDVKIPIIYVVTTYQGISPEDAERLIVKPLENSLRSIEGIKEMTSYASEGSGSVIMEFEAGFNSNKAIQDVRAGVDDAEHDLPTLADRPSVHEISLSLKPVVSIILSGDASEAELITTARNLREKLQGLPEVMQVNIAGDRDEALEINIEPKILENYSLSTDLLAKITDNNNRLVAAGNVRTSSGEYSIKVPALIENVTEFLDFPIKAKDNQIVRFRDITDIKRTFKDANVIARVNGKSAVVVEVSKRTGENIISTVSKVKQIVESERKYWPPEIGIIYSQDESSEIQDMVADLENNILIGVVLVLIVIILSVGSRSAIIIALSIPASFLAGILVLSAYSLTLNIVVLFSLILTVGMIVDDAIVVSEYADRKMIEGVSAEDAYIIAAKRMLWPIVTSTLVKILVFLPLLYWPGVVGQFMKYMPITVVAILSSSLIFALFIQPTIGPLFGAPIKTGKDEMQAMQASEEGNFESLKGITKKYATLLNHVLDKPKTFVYSIICLLLSVYIYFFFYGTGKEFFPNVEPNVAQLIIQSPGNLSLEQKNKIIRDVEQRIMPLLGDVKVFYSKSGNISGQNLPDDTIGVIQIEFNDWDKRKKAAVIVNDILRRIEDIKGIKAQIIQERSGPPSLKPIEINFSSHNPSLMDAFINKFLDVLNKTGGYKNLEDTRTKGVIEWKIKTDRAKAAAHGVSVQNVGDTIKLITNGLKVSSYRPADSIDEVDIILRFPKQYRKLSTLDTLKIVNNYDKPVALSDFITVSPQPKVGQIKRVDRERVITVSSDVESGILVDDKISEIKKWLNDNFDSQVKVSFKGDDEDQQETMSFLLNAFFIALVLMFMTMLIQFNNFYHTIIVMSAVFLSTVGVLIGLLITFQPFGIVMCGVGIIALAGVVLNNNILFVDTYQKLRLDGFEVRRAIVTAGTQRLRPILLTACTAILGLLPMVFNLTINIYERKISYGAPSSQWWTQLSTSIAGGLAFATILTLFFTPCLLLLGKRFDSVRDEN